MANAVPLAGVPFGGVQSQPPGRGPEFLPATSGHAGHRRGPVADMPAQGGQGPCRNQRPKQLPRRVQAAAGATRAEGPEEGQVNKPAPCVCEAAACRMRTSSGAVRARAQRCATPMCMSTACTTPQSSERRSLRAALRIWNARSPRRRSSPAGGLACAATSFSRGDATSCRAHGCAHGARPSTRRVAAAGLDQGLHERRRVAPPVRQACCRRFAPARGRRQVARAV